MTRSSFLFFLIATILLSFSGCEKPNSDSPASVKNEPRDQAVSYQKKVTKYEKPSDSRKKFSTVGKNQKKTNVRIKQVNLESLSIKSTYVGYLLPNKRVLMRSEIDGVIEKIDFEEGDEITKGKRLVDISTKEHRLKLKIAITDSNLADINIKRDEKLASQNLISNAQLDQTRTRAESASLNKELAEISLNKSLISSPLKGTIKTRHIKVGEFVRKGDKLVEILDIDKILVKVNIPEQEILSIQVGQNVEVALYIMEKKTFLGRVKNIGLEADSSNRTFPVEILVDNKERQLRAGMLARATFTKNVDQDQIVIPRHTVLERDQGRVVYVFEDGKAFRRDITIGLSQQDQVQVVQGLNKGELIVVEGHTKLTDGEEVNVVN
ncbi:MAG: efflux RND transporter periplasmic adaptor subunit [SAR324 cluster bacterium]|nr:efflux RND transporter periplasmic adaptor subunit [SAR324 cluster bacterium]